MATLKELIDQHRDQVPGLKVRHAQFAQDNWFEVWAAANREAIGYYASGGAGFKMLASCGWELYQPPAPAAKSVYVQMLKPGTVLRVTEGGIEMETPDD